MDLVRRRRWHRKLVQQSEDAGIPVFKMDVGDVSFHADKSTLHIVTNALFFEYVFKLSKTISPFCCIEKRGS